MVEEGLIVKFKGEDDSLQKASTSAAASIDKVTKSSAGAAKALGQQTTVSQKASAAAQDLSNKAAQTGGSVAEAGHEFAQLSAEIDKTEKKSYTARFAVQNLGNVIRDVPFGINNPAIFSASIDHVASSFAMLKQEAGSSAGALKLLGESLSGGGGILIAVNLISLAVTFLSQAFSGSTSDADTFSDSLKRIADESDNAVESVGNLQSILSSSSGTTSLVLQIGGKGQVDILKKDLESMQILRDEASKQLEAQRSRDLYAELKYFDLDDEARKKADATIKQHNDNITKLQQSVTDFNRQISDQNLKIKLQENKDTEDANKKAEETRKKAQQKADQDAREALRKLKEYQSERAAIIGDFSKDFEAIKVPFPKAILDKPDVKANADLANKLQDELNKALLSLPAHLQIPKEVIGLKAQKLPIPLKIEYSIQKDLDAAKKVQEEMEKFKEKMNQILANGIASGISNVGEGIGQALAGGGDLFQTAGRAFMQSLGDLITQIGKAEIEYGVVKEGLDKILSAGIVLPGIAAIGAGLAAVAIGSLIKNSFQPKKFAAGSLVYGPTLGMVGEGIGTSASNPEIVAPLDKLKQHLGGGRETVVMAGDWKIRGNDLVFLQAQTQKRQRRAG